MTSRPPLPPVAVWHGLTRQCAACGHAHLSLRLEGGSILRLRLSPATIADLAAVLAGSSVGERQLCPPCANQSSSSSGSAQPDGSTPEPGQKLYPPTSSSSADPGE